MTLALLINSANMWWCLKIGVCGSKRTAGVSKSSVSHKECIYSVAEYSNGTALSPLQQPPSPFSQVYPGPMCCKPAWQIMLNRVRKMEKILLEVRGWWVRTRGIYTQKMLHPFYLKQNPSKGTIYHSHEIPMCVHGTQLKDQWIEAQPHYSLWLTSHLLFLLFPPHTT